MDYDLNSKEQATLLTDVGIFARNDAPAPFCGAGSGGFYWFNNYQEMAQFFRGFMVHECLLRHIDESEHAAAINFIDKLASNLEGDSPNLTRIIELYNDTLKGIDQIEWIGSFEALCSSNDKWETELREFVNGDSDAIAANGLKEFSDNIMTYGC